MIVRALTTRCSIRLNNGLPYDEFLGTPDELIELAQAHIQNGQRIGNEFWIDVPADDFRSPIIELEEGDLVYVGERSSTFTEISSGITIEVPYPVFIADREKVKATEARLVCKFIEGGTDVKIDNINTTPENSRIEPPPHPNMLIELSKKDERAKAILGVRLQPSAIFWANRAYASGSTPWLNPKYVAGTNPQANYHSEKSI